MALTNRFITGSKLGYLRKLFKTNPTKALILAGKTVLENAGWTREELVKTASHKYIRDFNGLDEVACPSAGSFCAVGSLQRGCLELTGKVDYDAVRCAEAKIEDVNDFDLVQFNDRKAKSKASVIKAFSKAV